MPQHPQPSTRARDRHRCARDRRQLARHWPPIDARVNRPAAFSQYGPGAGAATTRRYASPSPPSTRDTGIPHEHQDGGGALVL